MSPFAPYLLVKLNKASSYGLAFYIHNTKSSGQKLVYTTIYSGCKKNQKPLQS